MVEDGNRSRFSLTICANVLSARALDFWLNNEESKKPTDCHAMLGRASLSVGAALIATERSRQIEAEGWSEKHDDEHLRMDLTRASISYALHVWIQSKLIETYLEEHVLKAAAQTLWPWEYGAWKPATDPVRTLVKAGALIAAEIDRL